MRWCCLAIVLASCSTPPVGEVPQVDETPAGRTDTESARPSGPSPASSSSPPSPPSPRPETGPDIAGPKDAPGRPRRDSILAKGWKQFWEEDLERYPPHVESRRVLDTIDEADLRRYCFVERGLHPSAPEIGSGRDLASYMEARGLGSPACRAWTELLGLAQGKTSFDRALPLLDALRAARGFEFTPTAYVLFFSKPVIGDDGARWFTAWKDAFVRMGAEDLSEKFILVMCLFRQGVRLKETAISPEDIQCLEDEYARQDSTDGAYAQNLLLALYQVHSTQRRFREAGRAAERIRPEGPDLTLAFTSYILAKDIPAARAVLERLRRLEPPGRPDEETLRRRERTLADLERRAAGESTGGE